MVLPKPILSERFLAPCEQPQPCALPWERCHSSVSRIGSDKAPRAGKVSARQRGDKPAFIPNPSSPAASTAKWPRLEVSSSTLSEVLHPPGCRSSSIPALFLPGEVPAQAWELHPSDGARWGFFGISLARTNALPSYPLPVIP